jgi:trk system potassium uptake protein TrkH
MGIKNFFTNLPPIHKVLLSFIILILTGTLLLLLPFSTRYGISFIDALFTSTSAVCVTGLIVVDTAKDFTLAGQIIILTLIQLGGFGIMTFSIAIMALFGSKFSIKWGYALQSIYSDVKALPVKGVLKRIVVYTFYIEIFTAILLFTQFHGKFSLGEALWHSIFHSISSFCNAGFSTFPDSLTRFRANPTVILASSFAIIMGGIGFFALAELSRGRYTRRQGLFKQFSLHTRLVLVMTGLLLLIGTVIILMLEWDHVLGGFPIGEKLLTAFYHSVSCRTAGFNTVDIGSMRESTLFALMGLMFVGGSPGSIAGGIKTTTIAAVSGLIYSKLRGKKQVIFWGRGLDFDTVDRSTTLIIMAWLFIFLSTFLLLFIHSFDRTHTFLSGLFEVTSAFNTVGLTTGVTSTISDEGKILLSFVMYIGRLGPLTLIAALTSRQKDVDIEYAEENIMIG